MYHIYKLYAASSARYKRKNLLRLQRTVHAIAKKKIIAPRSYWFCHGAGENVARQRKKVSRA